MVMFLGFMAAITLVMWLAPGSPAGRALNEQLVERPLASLSKMRRHHLIYAVLITGLMLPGGEIMLLLGPEVAAAFYMDLALYLDAVFVTYALSAVAAVKSSGSRVRDIAARALGRIRPRRKRTQRTALPRISANDDDEDHPAKRPLAA